MLNQASSDESRWTVAGSKAERHTAIYSAPSGPGVLYRTHSPRGAITACPPFTSTTPVFDSTRSAPFKTTVYSSNSGLWPGSLHPEGLCMWAMLTAESWVLTRPTYSSICLLPGTGMRAAAGTNRGMLSGLVILMIAIGDQLGKRVHRALIGRIGELAHDGPGTFGERLRAFSNAIEPVACLDHAEDLLERGVIVIAVFQNRRHQLPLFRRRFFERVDQRQRHLTLAQIAAHRLAEHLLVRCEVQHVIH